MTVPEVVEVRLSHVAGPHQWNSEYVRLFWTPTLGPTASLLWQNLMHRFDNSPGQCLLVNLHEAGRELGVKPSIASNAFKRLVDFGVMDEVDGRYMIHGASGRLRIRQVTNLTSRLQVLHAEYERSLIQAAG